MAEEDKNSSPLDEGTEIIAHTAQTAYATTAAVAAGGTAAGMAAGCGQAAVGNGQVAAGTGQVAGNRQDSRRYYADRTPDPAFLQFLDTEDFDLRMECLKALEERVTQQELDSIYLVLDMKPEQGSLQEQLYAVRRFLTMQKRYDGSRLR